MTRSEQSRINGAKSKGPITIDGKSRSSQNAIKHGFAAAINTVLGIEDEPAWHIHLEGHRTSFLPKCYVEQTMVEQLASISWRQSRLVGLETALIGAQISIQKDNVCDLHPDSAADPYFHLVLAWQALARQPQKPAAAAVSAAEPADHTLPPFGYDINSIELVRRYLVSLDRQYRNVLLNLRQYRKDFAAPAEPVKPNEPEPVRQNRPAEGANPPTHTENPTAPVSTTGSSKQAPLPNSFANLCDLRALREKASKSTAARRFLLPVFILSFLKPGRCDILKLTNRR
jgi:hypothetical protein